MSFGQFSYANFVTFLKLFEINRKMSGERSSWEGESTDAE